MTGCKMLRLYVSNIQKEEISHVRLKIRHFLQKLVLFFSVKSIVHKNEKDNYFST